MVAQTQKGMFLQHDPCAILESPTILAQHVAQKRQSRGRTIAIVAQGLPWSQNEGTVVARVITQWTLLVGQRRHKGGTMEAEAARKLIYNGYNSMHFYGATNGWTVNNMDGTFIVNHTQK